MSVLGRILKANRGWVTFALFISLLANVVQLVYAHFVGILVNRIVGGNGIILELVILLFLLILTLASLNYLDQMVGNYTAEKASHTLRMGYMRFLLESPKGATMSADQAMSTVQGELALSSDFFSNSFFFNISMVITCILVLIFLFFENALLSLAFLIPTLLILIYVAFSGSKLAKITKDTLAAKRRMNRTAFSAITNHPVISVFDAGAFLEEKYDQDIKAWEKSFRKDEQFHAVLNSISGLLSKVPLLCLFLVGGYMVISGTITLGTFIVFLNLQNNVTGFLMNTPTFLAHFRTFTSNLKRIDIILEGGPHA